MIILSQNENCFFECMQNPISEFHLMLVLKLTNIKCNIFNGAFSGVGVIFLVK